MTQPFSRKLSLQPLLMIPFVLLLLGSVGLVGWLSFSSSQRAVNTLATRLREELTQRIQQELQNYVETPFLINQLNASAFARGTLPLTELGSYVTLWEQARNFPTTNLIYCGGEADGAFFGVGRPNATDNTDAQFQVVLSNPSTNSIYHYHNISETGELDRTLRDKGDRPFDPRIRPWYEAAAAKQSATWSDIYLDFDALIPVITASVPVYDDGQLLGVCATDFLLSVELDGFLEQLQVGQTGETFIIERDGTLVSSSTADDEALVVSADDSLERLLAVQSQNDRVSAATTYLQNTFGSFDRIQSPEQLSFRMQGQKQFIQVSPFQDERGLDWLIVVVIPESDFMQEIYANARITVVLCAFTLLGAILIGHLVARRVTRPILEINQASQAIATGSLDQRVSPSNTAELDNLSQSFNGMANQLQASIRSLEAVNQTLEQRVAERTAELTVANTEIQALNRQLTAENKRLGSELEVAHKLQTMILPKHHELEQISDLDISGFMEAAEEVGGDYYDILQASHHAESPVRIGIGDVTGHGLESGVLMIMIQTAVLTLLAIGEHDLTKTLTALNSVIYRNVQRMGLDRQITLSLLDYRHGDLCLSGQHESVIVMRSHGEIELIDTFELGFPLGLVDDISAFVGHHYFHLEPGDGVVLYTDGITEAERQVMTADGCDRQLYGLDRLVAQLKQHWHQPALTIRRAILSDVQQHIGAHKVYDDITLVIFKRRSLTEL